MRKIGRILRFLTTQAILLILFFAIAEVGLRVFAPISAVHDPTISQQFEQTISGVSETILYERNRFGFRTNHIHQHEKPADTIRIFCLGASTTDQTTQSYADTWCGLIESNLNAQLDGVRVETAAYGRGGWRAIHQLFFRPDLAQFDADYAIFLLGINDLALNGGATYTYDGIDAIEEKLKEPGIVSGSAAVSTCLRTLQLCRRANLAADAWQIRQDKKAGRTVEWHSENLPQLRSARQSYPFYEMLERNPDPYDEFVDVVDRLVADVVADGVEPILLGQPTLWKDGMSAAEKASLWMPIDTPEGAVRVSGAWLAAEMARYNAAQAKIAAKHTITYIPIEEDVPKTAAHFFDDTHFTDLGSELVADQIVTMLLPILARTD